MVEAKRFIAAANRMSYLPPFTPAQFFKELATALKRKVTDWHPTELQAMQHAWDNFGPFEPALIHIALAKAILDKKTDQHISFYLDYIIKTHINHQPKEQ